MSDRAYIECPTAINIFNVPGFYVTNVLFKPIFVGSRLILGLKVFFLEELGCSCRFCIRLVANENFYFFRVCS